MTKRLRGGVRVAAIALCGAALCLSGCAQAHEALYADQSCSKCHDDERTLDYNASFSAEGACYSTTGVIEVSVDGASSFYVCRAVGSTYAADAAPVPVISRTVDVESGQSVEITLEAGAYILVAQHDGSVDSQLVIVTVGDVPDGAEADKPLHLSI